MRINAKGLHWTVAKLADGSKKTYWYAWRGGPRLSGEYGSPEFIASYQCRRRHQGRRAGGPVAEPAARLSEEPRFSRPARAHPRRLHHTDRRRSSRNLPTLRSRRSPIRARAASSWIGATSWRCARSGRPTMRGPCSPACCHGRRIAARSPSIPASAAAASITARASISCGASRTRPPFSNTRRRICICRCCSRYGPGSGKAICCGCRGRPMTGTSIRLRQSKTGARVVIPVGCAAQGRARCHTEAQGRSSSPRPTGGRGRRTASARILASGVQEGGHRRPYVQRSARHCGHPACACRLHRGADRFHHRAQFARRTLDPRRALSAPRCGVGAHRHHQARNGLREAGRGRR